MREELISFIWKFGLYRRSDLCSVHGEKISVSDPGKLNHFDGPDFGNARIKVHGVIWSGAIELHYLSSDWYRHGHDQDPAYDQVILHVCWVFDKEVRTCSGRIPIHVRLSDHTDEGIIHSLHQLWSGRQGLLCSSTFSGVPKVIIDRWLGRMAVMNMHSKVQDLRNLVDECGYDRRKAVRVRLAQILGIPGNKDLLGQFIQGLDHMLISRKRDDLNFLLAYFLGEAGIIPGQGRDSYTESISSTYRHVQRMTSSNGIHWSWRTKGIRSGNITSRLVSLAVFIHRIDDLEGHSIEDEWNKKMDDLASAIPDYWRSHRSLSVLGKKEQSYFTKFVRSNIFINLIVPYYTSAQEFSENQSLHANFRSLLKLWKPEDNKLTRRFIVVGAQVSNADDSQALKYLYTNYCQHKKCVNCGIGRFIIREEVIHDRGDSYQI